MESRATTNSEYDVNRRVRGGSTSNLMDLDGSFMKPTIKKSHNPVVPITVSTGLPAEDNFHKTNTGTYYFPNGEIFRPRTGVSKRNRPSKINTHQHAADHIPDINRTTQEHMPRSLSFNSLNSLKSGTATGTYMTKSQSFTNFKQRNKQSLVRNLRNSKLDTATNIDIPLNSSYSRNNSLVKGSFASHKFQSGNIIKNGSCLSLQDDHHKLSDSNPSSLSNYNLNRSSSTTPTTSIDTSDDILDLEDAKPDSKCDGEDNLSILKETREESIRPLSTNNIDLASTIVLKGTSNLGQSLPEKNPSEEYANANDFIENYDEASDNDNDILLCYTDASNKEDADVRDMVLTEEETKAITLEHEVNNSQHDNVIPSITVGATNKLDGISTSDNISIPETNVNFNNLLNKLISDRKVPANDSAADDTSDLVGARVDGEPKDDTGTGAATLVETEEDKAQELKEEEDKLENREEDTKETGAVIEPEITELESGNLDVDPVKDRTNEDTKQQEEKESNVESDFLNNNEIDENNSGNDSLTGESPQPHDLKNVSDANDDLNEISTQEIENEEISKSPDNNRNSTYYEYPPLEEFDKLVYDNQTVPPRGDLEVLSDKIRKHERGSSSISSFNSIINMSDSSPSKRQNSPLPESNKPKPHSSPLSETFRRGDIAPLNSDMTREISNENSMNVSNIAGDVTNKVTPIESFKSSNQMTNIPPNSRNANSDTPEVKTMQNKIQTVTKLSQGPFEIPLSNEKPFNKSPSLKSTKASSFRKLSIPKGLNTLKSNNSQSKLKKSSSLADFKTFMKKIFSPVKETKKSLKKEDNLSLRSEKKPRRQFKSSVSLSSLINANQSRAVVKIDENELPDSNKVIPNKKNEPEVTPLQPFEKLPAIETEKDMFQDLMNVFDERMSEGYGEIKKDKTPKFSSDLFLRDDELTKDQIKDQQMKDLAGEDEVEEESSYILGPRDSNSDEEEYFDENIRFLQEEFKWTNMLDIDNLAALGRSFSIKERKDIKLVEKHREYLINKEEILGAFQNSNVCDKRNLPVHLKYVSQFKDFEELKVNVEYFNFTTMEDINNNKTTLIPILKQGNRFSSSKKVSFSNNIYISETFAPDMYKRYNRSVTQYTLTEPFEINKIKDEMNRFKCNEMLVHEESKDNTHFFY